MVPQHGRTALHMAAFIGQSGCVKALVRAGSDLAAVDKVSAWLSSFIFAYRVGAFVLDALFGSFVCLVRSLRIE